jgi:ABC-type nitrate/sulfonate/bicarbonate transport system ATPase subunit
LLFLVFFELRGALPMAETAALQGKLSIKDVCRTFNPQTDNELVALEHISLDIKSGEFVSLLGPSGCGKSTLLRLIAGLDQASEGLIYLDDQKVEGTHYERGMVFQDPTLYPWLSVSGNIAAGLKARSMYKKNKRLVREYVQMVGLEGFEKSYPHELSGGMAQRVSLARSLANHPKILLLDEPFGALDAFTRMNMQDELLRIWQERGTTMVLVTHDVDEALYLSDRVIIMTPRPGRVENIIPIKMSRPRARNLPEFLDLRVKILETFNFTHNQTYDEPMI